MPTFTNGQIVKSSVNAQGMTRGAQYMVVDVLPNSTAFGTFITYELVAIADTFVTASGQRVVAPVHRRLRVGNGHLVLSAVEGEG